MCLKNGHWGFVKTKLVKDNGEVQRGGTWSTMVVVLLSGVTLNKMERGGRRHSWMRGFDQKEKKKYIFTAGASVLEKRKKLKTSHAVLLLVTQSASSKRPQAGDLGGVGGALTSAGFLSRHRRMEGGRRGGRGSNLCGTQMEENVWIVGVNNIMKTKKAPVEGCCGWELNTPKPSASYSGWLIPRTN